MREQIESEARAAAAVAEALTDEGVSIALGAVGANFEARPNVAVDAAGQLLKSLNTAVLVERLFHVGDGVEIVGPDGEPFARGVAAVDADELADRPAAVEAVHRDRLVLLTPSS